MIFFGIPSVGQIKPKTLFGDDNHYGFIQTLLGEKYERSAIAKKCSEYYEKNTEDYWGRIITIINFLGIKKLNEENRFSSNQLLDFIAEKFDQSDFEPSEILFDYLLCQWQYPHPIVTKTTDLKALDITLVNPRQNVAVFKPYILILAILKELHKISPESSYFTKEEFYWFGYQAYECNCSNMKIGNESSLAISILNIRKNGWSKFKPIENLDKTSTHLNYPLGFLRNSSVLTDNGTEYDLGSEFFIGLKKSKSIITDINSLINSSKNIYEFDRNLSVKNNKLGFEYSNYLYSTELIKKWLEGVTIYEENKNLFLGIHKVDIINFNESEFKKRKVEIQLNRLSDLDQISISKRRTEQYILREYLLGGHDSGSCAICSKEYPIKFLATAHIKKRSKCTIEEKKDINVVMPTCHFGCDKLFEDGYVIVKEGIIQNNISTKTSTPSIKDYIHNLENNKCNYYNENTQRYFKEHEGSYV